MKPTAAAALGVTAVIVITLIGLALQTVMPTNPLAFLLFVPPILVTALVGGFGPTLLTTVLGGFSAEYFFRRPYGTFPDDVAELYPASLYVLIGIGIGILGGHLARARRDVQRREREFETLFNMTPIGIGIATDRECRHISVNPAFAEILQIPPTANASLTAPSEERQPIVIHQDGKPVPAEDLPLQLAARLGREVRNVELDVIHKDGTAVTLYEYATPLFDDRGEVRGAIGAFLDITERKNAEAALRRLADENEHLYREAQEAGRLKDEFLATLSHELRTPLNALLGWLQLLQSDHLTPEKRERALAAISRSAQLQAQLTSDLLDVSSAITGRLRLTPAPVHVGTLVDDVMHSLRLAAESKGVAVEHGVTVGEPLMLDPARLQQILWNLVSNAIKFTPRGGEIAVRAHVADGDLVIEVSDTGIGIAPDFLPHVFERFRQADAGAARRHGGLGLGLSIVKHLAELHGGHVTASSAGERQGATFVVRIPARVSVEQPDDAEARVAHG
jgi:signal transduction histidine kinase